MEEEDNVLKDKVRKGVGYCVLMSVLLSWLSIQYMLLHLLLPLFFTLLVLILLFTIDHAIHPLQASQVISQVYCIPRFFLSLSQTNRVSHGQVNLFISIYIHLNLLISIYIHLNLLIY